MHDSPKATFYTNSWSAIYIYAVQIIYFDIPTDIYDSYQRSGPWRLLLQADL